jgi:hypothetical protein
MTTQEKMKERIEAAMARYEEQQRRPRQRKGWGKKTDKQKRTFRTDREE